ncbi:cytochrome P450 [Periconia macrospinosa]|uniref:Cytochrome P450 n=1 Tax=Periconia macrospinosa TaxID=97972 RepID=A0A2V1DC61_9PLEO|nr:cytochrome P450 [Periconia macrospinosa]
MAITIYTAPALLLAIGWLIYGWLYNWRLRKHTHIPQFYPRSFLWGHLDTIGIAIKKLDDPLRHPDYAFYNLWKDAGCPQIMFFDLRPVTPPMTLIVSHDVAEQVSRITKMHPWSVTKSPTMQDLIGIVGEKSILLLEGENWKNLRRRFNAGFAPQHLVTLLPVIIQKANIFVDKLDALATSGAEAELEPLCTNLTFDIMGEIVCNLDLKAQDDSTGGHEIVHYFRKVLETYHGVTQLVPSFTDIVKKIERRYYANKADVAIKKCVKESFAGIKAAQETGQKNSQNRSVLSLALKDSDELTNEDLQIAADQVKTFFFAGHDTTSILLQRLFHELSRNPKCLAAIRAEHKAVLGDGDPRDALLANPDHTMNQLTYTSACIKETLRLWPPAGSARMPNPGKGFKVRQEDGSEVLVDQTVLYICHFITHRDPKVYGDTADDFVPERWLGNTSTAAADEGVETSENKIPVSAWRPFERGPRNCIGQELANLEARVILACVIRRFDFIKVGAGAVVLDEKGDPIVDEQGRYKTNGDLFNAQVITSKPFDKCRMKVRRAKE